MTYTNSQLSNYGATSTNMVQLIESIISGYKMGSIRALAQEPVQNSKDAKADKTVRVVFQLHRRLLKDGSISRMLTVTDSGTSGLGGPILTEDEIDNRGGILKKGEDWAAFEGHGYTKVDQDALGSRGQGKSAFLYHSKVANADSSPRAHRRMVMLYDTLLSNGEYRLGVRYASPRDTVLIPPQFCDKAKELITSESFPIDKDLRYPLMLAPLTEPGTRVVVPYLIDEAVDAFKNGELKNWLEMCWWRAIQVEELEIMLIDEDGSENRVGIPEWWHSEFWQSSCCSEHEYVKEDISLNSNPSLKIKRVVLLHDKNIGAHEYLYDSSEPEYDGIQVMRGRQWIETLGSKQDYSSSVPEEYRTGFRGFVEFERGLDRELRSTDYERPQHDSFDRRKRLVKDVLKELDVCVREFSERLGWISDEGHQEDASDLEQRIAAKALSILVNPPDGAHYDGGDGSGGTIWDVDLQIGYPNEGTTRVNWGQELADVYVSCRSKPKMDYGSVTFEVVSIAPDGSHKEIARTSADLREDGTAVFEFGNIPVLKGVSKQRHMPCPDSGKYRLNAAVSDAGRDLKRTSRSVWVEEDPPPPPTQKSVTVSVGTFNLDAPDRVRINDGELLSAVVSIKNRTIETAELSLDAVLVAGELPGNFIVGQGRLLSLPLAVDKRLSIEGIERLGEPPIPKQVIRENILLISDIPDQVDVGTHLVAAPGVLYLRIDLYNKHRDERIASTSRRIYFETDPPGNAGKLPFELIRQAPRDESREMSPLWHLGSQDREGGPDQLFYSHTHHIYGVAQQADRNYKRNSPGANAVIREIVADAYLDWMHEGYSDGDDSRYDTIIEHPDKHNNPRWFRLAGQVERYRDMSDDTKNFNTGELAKLRRKIVANLVRMFEETDA